ncbi:MAG TPA: type 4a pilus biogenesis protein PilO [Mycobacteriales bacterium]|nr:type 4a pilus biogenesis protein PilO [Mycobacteriales bacterium]
MTTTRRWVIGTAIAAVVILAAGWFLLVKPQKSKVSDLHTQTASQEQQNQLLQTQIAALQAEQKELPKQQQILQKFATQIPDTAAEPALIRALTQTAKAAGVDLPTITPGAPTAVSGASTAGTQALGAQATSTASLYSLPLALTVTGAYANLESFFAGLEHLPRAFLVSSFTVAPATGSGSSGSLPANALSASISTAVFYATGTAPIPVVSPEATTSATSQPAASGGSAPTSTQPSGSASNPAASAVGPARHAAGETS